MKVDVEGIKNIIIFVLGIMVFFFSRRISKIEKKEKLREIEDNLKNIDNEVRSTDIDKLIRESNEKRRKLFTRGKN